MVHILRNFVNRVQWRSTYDFRGKENKRKMKKVKLIFLMVAGLLLLAASPALAADPVSADTFTVTILENAKGAVSVSQTQDGEYTNPCTLEPIQEEGVDKGKGECYFKVTPEPGWELDNLYEKSGEIFYGAYSCSKIAEEGDSVIYSGRVVTPKDTTLYPVFKNTETGEFAYVEGTAPEVPTNIKLQTAKNKAGSVLIAHNDYTVDLNDQVFYSEIFFKNTNAYQNTCYFALKAKGLEGYEFFNLVVDGKTTNGGSVIQWMAHPAELEDGSVVWDAYISAEDTKKFAVDGVLKLSPIFKNIETGELVYCDETPVDPVDPVDPVNPVNPVDPVKPEPTVTPAGNEGTQVTTKTESTNPKTGIQEEMLWGAAAVISVAALAVVARKRLVRKK
ncbi:hypothetical protein SAMN04515624_1122 [Eubacterium maltosivorans]|nr:hypothetical protein EUMA32_29500 [Eubacterium maltosivorans]SDP43676.1 hypothetical protein SAMN04515624_1122 [Eubacterium maltosivorans]